MDSIFQELARQIAERNCILFLGPDISESAGGYQGLPTSWQIADELAAQCNYRGQYRPLPRIAQIYQHRFDKYELISYLRKRLDDSVYQPLPIHEIIARIPFPAIVYVGWDRLLERALDAQGITYNVVCSASDLGYTADRRLILYKPYGTLAQPDSLVITQDHQFEVFNEDLLLGELQHLMARYELLMVGYAIDYDAVFIQSYYKVRQQQAQHRHRAFIVQSLQHPEGALYWETLGITPIITDPTHFLYTLAQEVAALRHDTIVLPDLEVISQAAPVTQTDLTAHTRIMNRVLETLGVGELVEQSDVPLLSAEQVRDLEAMRAAYERLAIGLEDSVEAATMWLRQGNIEYVRQNYEKAESYYQRALAIQPELAEAYHNLHYVYLAQSATEWEPLKRQKLDAALQAYQRAIDLKPFLALFPARYTIQAVLGQGGMGVVYRAYDTQTQQPVAIKLVKRAYMYNERIAMRFRREAMLLQKVQDGRIVRYLESQQYQGQQFIVMEYLGDQTIAHLLKERGPFSLDAAHEIVKQVGGALQVAHQKGIIHRDIKPENIFLVDGQAKVIDFGLAAELAAGQPSIVGMATGTVRYMSPEQQIGGAIDTRTDIYALATVFYEMLTGQHPGEGMYHPLSACIVGVTPLLDIVIEKAREPDPAARYADMGMFCTELTQVVAVQPASSLSPSWLRGLAYFQKGITLVVREYWLLLPLLSLGIGHFFPYVLPFGKGRVMSRFTGLLLWDVFFLNMLTNFYTLSLARNTGYATLAAYGPTIGTFLALSTALIAWITFNLQGFGFERDLIWIKYVVALIIHSLTGVVVGGFSFLSIVSGLRIALRLRLGSRIGIVLSYGFALLILIILACILYALTY
ncbi:MAG: protein kinase [Anaerolineae bacterium]|nr:protein kinase [Anaerolineae bacterium]